MGKPSQGCAGYPAGPVSAEQSVFFTGYPAGWITGRNYFGKPSQGCAGYPAARYLAEQSVFFNGYPTSRITGYLTGYTAGKPA